MRACFSGACFVQAHTRETQQAFLEGHVDGFDFFGGVFGSVRYDNLGSAVAKVLRGRRRVETDRFVAMRSHYLFESRFTRAGKEGAHEKGGVEGDVGRFRRTYLVPVPEVASLAELNNRIGGWLIEDLGRTVRGRRETVGEALGRELDLLRPLPAEPFDTSEHATPRVDSKALATVRQNQSCICAGKPTTGSSTATPNTSNTSGNTPASPYPPMSERPTTTRWLSQLKARLKLTGLSGGIPTGSRPSHPTTRLNKPARDAGPAETYEVAGAQARAV
jgi:hypothetical protein